MTSVSNAIRILLERNNIDGGELRLENLSGGCIHTVLKVECRCGQSFVAKIGHDVLAMFRNEAAGLKAIGETETVRVPSVVACDSAENFDLLLMEYLPPASATTQTWSQFGATLAQLHSKPVRGSGGAHGGVAHGGERYGFDHDNVLGPTSQPNKWTADWVTFNQQHRIGHQIQLAVEKNLLPSRDRYVLLRLNENLGNFLPRHPKPVLLHGDLWSGNAIIANNGEVAVIDPAVYIGDGWADIAMMRLFGGFPSACEAAYTEIVEDHEEVEDRVAVYQIYHLLNHLNIFGSGYLVQVRSAVNQLEIV